MRPVIFVVDDDPAIARLLRYTLEAENFQIHTFQSAAQVLSQTARPHLFLLDRSLPDMDGLELCSQLRRSRLWADVPAIFVSGRSSESDRVEGLRLADDYIAKPFSPVELVTRVQAVLRCAKQHGKGCLAPPPNARLAPQSDEPAHPRSWPYPASLAPHNSNA